MLPIYEPQEDSYFILEYVIKYSCGNVLDMGTGSGIQGINALKQNSVSYVDFVDLNENALSKLKEKLEKVKTNKKYNIIKSDLFKSLNKKYDTIIFNPPYLPYEKEETYMNKYIDLYGGVNGYEVICDFLNQVSKYMTNSSKLIILYTSLTNEKVVKKIISKNLLTILIEEKKKLFFEEMFVNVISKSETLIELEEIYDNLEYYTQGWHSYIYKGVKKIKSNNQVEIIKIPKNNTSNDAKKEADMINYIQEKLNQSDEKELFLLPKVNYISEKGLFFSMSEIKGDSFDIILNKKNNHLNFIKKIFINLIKVCRFLDLINIDKDEFMRPYSNVIISDSNISLIDFERAKFLKRPRNLSQYISFLINNKISKEMFLINDNKKEKIIKLLKEYKKTYADNYYFKLLNHFN